MFRKKYNLPRPQNNHLTVLTPLKIFRCHNHRSYCTSVTIATTGFSIVTPDVTNYVTFYITTGKVVIVFSAFAIYKFVIIILFIPIMLYVRVPIILLFLAAGVPSLPFFMFEALSVHRGGI